MHSLLKCQNCDWIDYLEVKHNRCPECMSRTESAKDPFAGEIITCVITSMARKKTKVPVTFESFTERFDKIVTDKELASMFDSEIDKDRINLMMRSYVWIMLKRQPQLWIHVNSVIKGLKELMFLRMDKQLNQK